jgi:RNA polymerase sigma factor (sigma-70 family)
MTGDKDNTTGRQDTASFRTTHWSIVLAAGQQPSTAAHQALTHLCQTYWRPVCVFIHRRGHDLENAKDLTQSFFVRLIESPDFIQAADRERGRFRTFLLTAVRNYLINVREREHAVKRGGGITFVPLEGGHGEIPWAEELADHMTPDKAFERRWALTLLHQTMTLLQREFVEAGKADQFAVLEAFLPGGRNAGVSYIEAAQELKSSEAAVRQAAHRMRSRFRHHLRSEVAQTVGTPAEVDDELNYLLAVLAS